MPLKIDNDRFEAARAKATQALLAARHPNGHWEGRLSSSALSTATSLGALAFVARQSNSPHPQTRELVEAGLQWLADNVNEDGGWGDTDLSFSNISTTTLCWAAFAMAEADARYPDVVKGAENWLTKAAGGIEPDKLAPAIIRRYGKDKTFSVPILTMCVISGRLGSGREAWKWVKQLPFELAAFPHQFFAALRLPVVSYALPALIAIGNARHARRPTWNPLTRWFRNLVRDRTLEKLKSIQPGSGGFLEASPLTSFVAMSLAAAGQVGHPVTQKCVEFLVGNAREDGSWPIDTNLATWVTTLAINALGDSDSPVASDDPVRDWLYDQQYKDIHPYTNAAPGGWAWTDLSGGVPDADDTAGALIAITTRRDPDSKYHEIVKAKSDEMIAAGPNLLGKYKNTGRVLEEAMAEYVLRHEEESQRKVRLHAQAGVRWLTSLQNGDGGIPTFCKGWTNLPFDRSSPDITAHAIRGLDATRMFHRTPGFDRKRLIQRVRSKGLRFLRKARQRDGSWIPLWFGNQHESDEENKTYGTAKVVMAQTGGLVMDMGNYRSNQLLRDLAGEEARSNRHYQQRIWQEARKVISSVEFISPGVQWLLSNQQSDGGWGGGTNGPSSVEETALAVEALAPCLAVNDDFWVEFKAKDVARALERGVAWLVERVETDRWTQPSPIGFYFAKLWYYEDLYPVIFTVAALNRISLVLKQMAFDEELRRDLETGEA